MALDDLGRIATRSTEMCIPGCSNSEEQKRAAQQLPADNCGQTSLPCAKKKHFVIWFGAPGPFDAEDKSHHDKTWQNYLLPVWLLMKQHKLEVEKDEIVHWCIYKPAYDIRWKDDFEIQQKKWKWIQDDITTVQQRGAKNYPDYIQDRATEYSKSGYDIRVAMLNNATEYWNYLQALSDGSLKRVWYVGHASTDLWLTLYHDSHIANMHRDQFSREVIQLGGISTHATLKSKFSTNPAPSIFVGCNTANFAQEWKRNFGVPSEGADGKVDFSKFDLAEIKASKNVKRDNGSQGSWKAY